MIYPESALESDREARPGGFCELRPPWSTLRVLVSQGYLCLLIDLYIHTRIYVYIERGTKALIDKLCVPHQGRN